MTDAALVASGPEAHVRSIEVSVHGKWVRVPAAQINGQTIVVRGKLIKIASPHDADWTATDIGDPADCIGALKEERAEVHADIFFFSQKEPDNDPHYDYPMEMRSLAVAETVSVEAWWQKVSHGTRCNIKQAKKRGVEVKLEEFNDSLVRGIMSIQNENPVRQGRRFYHYGKTFDDVKHDHGSYIGSCDFICAYQGRELLGFLKLVYRGNVASIMQINSKQVHQLLRPTNALLKKAVEVCASKGIQHLTYGEFNYWNKRESTLRDFKVHNGFEEMLVPAYYVPLTPWGSLCVKMRLYRGVFGLLPTGAINAGLDLRRKWYQFKTNAGKMSSPLT
jgi:hypothetical protein